MIEFPIHIDATQLVNHVFQIPGNTTDWISTRRVQILSLEPGRYNFQIDSGYYVDFIFTVTPKGTVDYDTAFNNFLSGRGAQTHTISGFEVTLDARCLSGSGVYLTIPSIDKTIKEK